VVNQKAPKNKGYVVSPTGTRLSKIEAIIGPNGSGKTNLLKVLPFIRWLIVDSFGNNPNDPILIKPYAFDSHKDKPIKLSVEFEIDKEIYKYTFHLNEAHILFEELKIKSKSKKRNTYKTLFYRRLNERDGAYSFNGKSFGLHSGFDNTLRSNASVIAVAVRFNHELSKKIYDYWQTIISNVSEGGWSGDKTNLRVKLPLPEIFNFYDQNEEFKKRAEKLLSKFDTGLEALAFKKSVDQIGQYLNVEGVHEYNGKRSYLDFNYESSGTRQLLILLGTILVVLDKGGAAIIDELDSSLHSEIVSSLIEMFLHPESNPHNAQLLFTTHNLLVLNLLDKYQVNFTEKSYKGFCEAWRLDSISGVRGDDNYFLKYMAGVYGALPNIK
jgi:hypothetical protein